MPSASRVLDEALVARAPVESFVNRLFFIHGGSRRSRDRAARGHVTRPARAMYDPALEIVRIEADWLAGANRQVTPA